MHTYILCLCLYTFRYTHTTYMHICIVALKYVHLEIEEHHNPKDNDYSCSVGCNTSIIIIEVCQQREFP